MHRAAPSQGHHDYSDSDGSSMDDGPTPRGRRGNVGGGNGVGARGGGGRGRGEGGGGDDAGALRSSLRRPRRRQRAATGQRAEDLKTYDPKAIGECLAAFPPHPRTLPPG